MSSNLDRNRKKKICRDLTDEVNTRPFKLELNHCSTVAVVCMFLIITSFSITALSAG